MALLSDRDEVLVVALGELGHHVLRALRQLAHHPPRGPGHSEQVDDASYHLHTTLNIVAAAGRLLTVMSAATNHKALVHINLYLN